MADENKDTTQPNKDASTTDSRKAAIEKAMQEVETKLSEEGTKDDSNKDEETEEAAPSKDTEKKEEKAAKKDAKKSDLDDEVSDEEVEEIDNAVRLFRALNDPKQSVEIVKAMATKAGLLKDLETKEEIKAAKDDFEGIIKEVIATEFGEEYKFLADKLTKIFAKIVPTIADAKTKKIEEDLKARDDKANKEVIGNALLEVYSQYEKIPRAVEIRFQELLDEMPPTPKTNPKTYFSRLIKIAADETESTLKLVSGKPAKDISTSQKDKNERNKRDATSHLASESASGVDKDTAVVPEFKTRKDAIRAAIAKADAETHS